MLVWLSGRVPHMQNMEGTSGWVVIKRSGGMDPRPYPLNIGRKEPAIIPFPQPHVIQVI